MASTIWPVDAVSGAPSYTGRKLRQTIGALWGGKTATRPLGAASGVVPGTPSSTVTASSSTWTVQPHCGVIDGETAAAAGPYAYSFDTAQTGSMTAASGSNPRIDLISIQISDPAESDGSSTPAVAVVYTTGTPAASPSPPATPTRSLAIAQINVPISGGGSPSVSWIAPYAVAAGGVTPCASSSFYPASPYVGQPVYDATLGYALIWNGTVWLPTASSGRAQYRNTSAQTIAVGSFGTITSWASETDTIGLSPSSGVFTFPAGSDGTYKVSAHVSVAGFLAGNVVAYAFFKNGSRFYYGEAGQVNANQSAALPPMEFAFVGGDQLTLRLDLAVGSSGPTTFLADTNMASRIRVERAG